MKNIDIIRLSASRPEMLKASTERMLERMKFSGQFRMILHEDVLNESASRQVISWAEKSGYFDVIGRHDPPLTQGRSIDWLLKRTATKYVVNFEDDWLWLRDVFDLDQVVNIMEENPGVNQIAWHKRSVYSHRYTWAKKEVERSGQKLTTNPHWAFTPAIWRMSYVLPIWQYPPAVRNPVWFFNPIVKSPSSKNDWRDASKMPGADWVINNSGHFFLGGIGEPAFVEHLGHGKSLREGHYKWKE